MIINDQGYDLLQQYNETSIDNHLQENEKLNRSMNLIGEVDLSTMNEVKLIN